MRCRSSSRVMPVLLNSAFDLGLVDAARRLAGEGARERLLDGGVDGGSASTVTPRLRAQARSSASWASASSARVRSETQLVGARLGILRLEREPARCSSSSELGDGDVGAVDDRDVAGGDVAPRAAAAAATGEHDGAEQAPTQSCRRAPHHPVVVAVAAGSMPRCSSSWAARGRPRSARSSRASSGRSMNHLLATLCFLVVRRVVRIVFLSAALSGFCDAGTVSRRGLDHVPAVGALDGLVDLTGRRR